MLSRPREQKSRGERGDAHDHDRKQQHQHHDALHFVFEPARKENGERTEREYRDAAQVEQQAER